MSESTLTTKTMMLTQKCVIAQEWAPARSASKAIERRRLKKLAANSVGSFTGTGVKPKLVLGAATELVSQTE